VLIVLGGILAPAVAKDAPQAPAEQPTVELSPGQLRTLLKEATQRYAAALIDTAAAGQADSPQAAQGFAVSANQFQSVVDSGVRNDRLYFNLANAYFQAGRPGQAIANYRRALRITPTEPLYYENLRFATEQAAPPDRLARPFWQRFNDVLLRVIEPNQMKGIFAVAWVMFWITLAYRLVRRRRHAASSHPVAIKLLAAGLLLVAVIAGSSYWLRVAEFRADGIAVLVGEAVVRQGDGEEFPVMTAVESAEGAIVAVLASRGGWMQVRLPDGTIGWVAQENAEVI